MHGSHRAKSTKGRRCAESPRLVSKAGAAFFSRLREFEGQGKGGCFQVKFFKCGAATAGLRQCRRLSSVLRVTPRNFPAMDEFKSCIYIHVDH